MNKGVEIMFADGKRREIRPLTLRQLRKFMKIVKDMNADEQMLSDEDLTRMVEASAVVLEKVDPDLAGDLENLEDVLDIKTFNVIFAIAMGADPNA